MEQQAIYLETTLTVYEMLLLFRAAKQRPLKNEVLPLSLQRLLNLGLVQVENNSSITLTEEGYSVLAHWAPLLNALINNP